MYEYHITKTTLVVVNNEVGLSIMYKTNNGGAKAIVVWQRHGEWSKIMHTSGINRIVLEDKKGPTIYDSDNLDIVSIELDSVDMP